MSRWAMPEGDNGRRGGSGMELVTIEEAKEMCERHGSDKDYIEAFGQPEEG